MITARAFAKINLNLRIVGIQPDGYHELHTTFQSIALHDVMTFASAPRGVTIESDDPRCPAVGNIVQRAAAALWAAAGRGGSPPGVRVRIDKRIPIEAGLGGGSADGATALRALALLWRLNVSRPEMRRIAASLGADVPYFLRGGTVVGRGRGDLLSAVADSPRRWVVLAVPPFGVATNTAYGWFDEGAAKRRRFRRAASRRRANDLQAVVVARHPEIGELVSALTASGASHAAMSGSGSAVFGLFGRLTMAEAAADALVRTGRRVLVTRTLSRRSYARLSRPVLARK